MNIFGGYEDFMDFMDFIWGHHKIGLHLGGNFYAFMVFS